MKKKSTLLLVSAWLLFMALIIVADRCSAQGLPMYRLDSMRHDTAYHTLELPDQLHKRDTLVIDINASFRPQVCIFPFKDFQPEVHLCVPPLQKNNPSYRHRRMGFLKDKETGKFRFSNMN